MLYNYIYSNILGTQTCFVCVGCLQEAHFSNTVTVTICMLLHFFNVKITVMSNFWAMVTIQKIFLDRQMHQDVKILQLFRRWLLPPSSGCFWWLDALLPSVCTWVQGGVRANPLSGQSQTIIELGLGCLLMAVHVVLLYWLSCAMFSLTRSQLFYWSFCNIIVSLLLLSLYGSYRWLSWSIYVFFEIEFCVLDWPGQPPTWTT